MAKWAEEELDIIRDNFGDKPIRLWSHLLPDRSLDAIHKKAQRIGLYSDVKVGDYPPPRYEPALPKPTSGTFDELWESLVNYQRMSQELNTRLDPVDIYLDVDKPIGVGFIADTHIGSMDTPLDQVRSRFEMMQEQPWLYLVSAGDTHDNFLPTKHGGGVFGTMFPPELQKELVVNLYGKMRGRWLALVQGCFLKGTPILMANGMEKPIESVRIEDLVFSEGKPHEVVNTFKNFWDGEMIALNVMGVTKTIHATSNHEFYIKSRDGKETHPIKTSDPLWMEAGGLLQGDYIGFPKVKGGLLTSHSEEEMEIFGWWLAEGSYQRKDSVVFSLGIDEKTEANKIRQYYELRGHKVYYHERPERNTIDIAIRSSELVSMYRGLFGEYCDGKRIPTAFLYYPLSHQQALLKGLFNGDGHQRDNAGPETAWTTTSPYLQSQIRQILFRLGHFTSTSYYERDGKKPYWVLTFRHEPKRPRHLIDDEYLWLPIRDVERYHYCGFVYNFEVENTHTYEVGGAKVKNCHEEWSHDADDFDFTKYLASSLGAANLGFGGQINLHVGEQLYQIVVRHKYRYNSGVNFTHTCKQLRRMEYPMADIVVVSHHHQAAVEQMPHSDKDRIYIRPGSMKGPDRYARGLGYTKTGSAIPTVILWPDKRQMLSFLNLEEAVEVSKSWY